MIQSIQKYVKLSKSDMLDRIQDCIAHLRPEGAQCSCPSETGQTRPRDGVITIAN